MAKSESNSNTSILQTLNRLQGITIIKKESTSLHDSRRSNTCHDELNISINTEPKEIHQKLSNPFVNKTIKFRVPPSAAKDLKLQVRKYSIPNDGFADRPLQHVAGSPMLYPNCSKCGAKLDNLPEFQKRIAGYESNFLIDFVCVRCVNRRQAVASDKRKFEELAVEIVKKFSGQPSKFEETLYIENVSADDVKTECLEELESNIEYLDSESECVSGVRDANSAALPEEDILSIGAEYLEPKLNSSLANVDLLPFDKEPASLSSIVANRIEMSSIAATELTLLHYDDNDYTEDENEPVDGEDDAEPMQYHCVECNRSYTSLVRLKDHGYYMHNPLRQRKLRARPNLPYKCDICHYSYHTLPQLKSHIYYMHIDCPSSLAKRPNKDFKMINRQSRQRLKAVGATICKICMAEYGNVKSLRRHELKRHADDLKTYPDDSIFQCHVCSFAYKSYKALQSHIYYLHSNDLSRLREMRLRRSRRNCSYNIVRQGRKVMLLLLKPLFDDGTVPMPPTELTKDDTFIVQSQNEATAKYNCPLCACHYKTSILMKTHLRFFDHDAVLHRRPTFDCQHCKTAYRSMQSLKNHFYYKHKNLKPPIDVAQTKRRRNAVDNSTVLQEICADIAANEIRCRFCGKKYASFKNLKNHVYYKHPKERAKVRPKIEYLDEDDNSDKDENFQFYCEHCAKRYPSFKYLQCHFYYMHRGEKPKKPDQLTVTLEVTACESNDNVVATQEDESLQEEWILDEKTAEMKKKLSGHPLRIDNVEAEPLYEEWLAVDHAPAELQTKYPSNSAIRTHNRSIDGICQEEWIFGEKPGKSKENVVSEQTDQLIDGLFDEEWISDNETADLSGELSGNLLIGKQNGYGGTEMQDKWAKQEYSFGQSLVERHQPNDIKVLKEWSCDDETAELKEKFSDSLSEVKQNRSSIAEVYEEWISGGDPSHDKEVYAEETLSVEAAADFQNKFPSKTSRDQLHKNVVNAVVQLNDNLPIDADNSQPYDTASIVDLDADNVFSDEDDPTVGIRCSSCFRCFKSKILRDAHEKYKHKKGNLDTSSAVTDNFCALCRRYFKTLRKLKYHTYYYHTDRTTARHKCRLCDDEFRSTTLRVTHERLNHRNADTLRYDCQLCDDTFVKPDQLHAHLNNHFGVKPFMCQDCGRGFTIEKYLKLHMLTHRKKTDAKRNRFECDRCELKFRYNSQLKKHAEVHQEHRLRFQCDHCVRTFMYARDFRRHQLSHTDIEKEHRCHLCDFAAHLQTDLRRHLRDKHGIYQRSLDEPLRC